MVEKVNRKIQVVRVLIALEGRADVPKQQEEIKLQVTDYFFFSFKILCCHDDIWFHLNLTLSQTLS